MPDHGIFEKVEIYGAVPGFIIRHTRPGSQIVKSHWHPELEINTAFEGSSRFFINGPGGRCDTSAHCAGQ